jgi:predicted Zn finger-like uncharacterized protein
LCAEPIKYLRCIKCTSCYKIDADSIGTEGLTVKCDVCDSHWRAMPHSVQTADSQERVLLPIDDRAIRDIQKQIRERKKPSAKFHFRKESLYIGNLPLSYQEADIGNSQCVF